MVNKRITQALFRGMKWPSWTPQIAVEATVRAAPRDVEALLGGPWRRLRRKMGNQPLLLVAPYVGERVWDLLVEEDISYVDLTGNARISLVQAGIFIETQGATSDPGATRQRCSLRGAKAGGVVRALVDAARPTAQPRSPPRPA